MHFWEWHLFSSKIYYLIAWNHLHQFCTITVETKTDFWTKAHFDAGEQSFQVAFRLCVIISFISFNYLAECRQPTMHILINQIKSKENRESAHLFMKICCCCIFSLFEAVVVVPSFKYSWKIMRARWIPLSCGNINKNLANELLCHVNWIK